MSKERPQDLVRAVGSESDLAADEAPLPVVADKLRSKAVFPKPQRRLEAPDGFQRLSLGSDIDGRTTPVSVRAASPAPRRSHLRQLWHNQAPVVYVFLSQMFGAIMNLCARLLETHPTQPMHPFQLLFLRMSTTAAVSCAYMYWMRVPDFPLGPRSVRGYLVVRGLSGFVGIFSMWFSIMYLPLAEATVITFLVPSVTSCICHVVLRDPFTRREQIASVLALLGVVLIARPVSLLPGFGQAQAIVPTNATAALEATALSGAAEAVAIATTVDETNLSFNATATAPASAAVPTAQRLVAVGVALLGVLGSAGAFTAIRAIGTRAHSLISVNYFSTAGTVVSSLVLALAPALDFGQPALRFDLPHSPHQWLLLFFTCLCGFGTQIFLTMGLGLERSNRATAMVYTNMLFAAGFDRFVFGNEMSIVSLVGCGMIVGSALWVALSKKPPPADPPLADRPADVEIGQVPRAEPAEGMPMLADVDWEEF